MKAPASVTPLGRFEVSPLTRALEERLLAAEIGETIPYTELSELVGHDVRTGARHLLQSATRRCLRQHRVVFGTVTGQGIRRLDPEGTLQKVSARGEHVRREATRGLREVSTLDGKKLTGDQRNTLALFKAKLSMVRIFSGTKSDRLLAPIVHRQDNALSAADLFRRTVNALTHKSEAA